LIACCLGLLSVAGCSSESTSETTDAGSTDLTRPSDKPIVEDLQGRSYLLHEPSKASTEPRPLLVMLHGFTGSETPEEDMENEMHVLPEADKRGIYVAQPRGSEDTVFGKFAWNATDACCGWNLNNVNDIGYIHAMVTEIESQHAIDPKRIFIFGHSNGGFMAHRLACDSAGRFAGIVSLAGAPWSDPKKCQPSAPIAMLQVHGTADTTVLYDGGAPYGIVALAEAPGAEELTRMWRDKNRCGEAADVSAAPVDLVEDLAGAETKKTLYAGCEGNGATELWTIDQGIHSPNFNASFASAIFDFLLHSPKP
jgi:polyhydroxybutyrate depolymerase